MSDNSDEQQFSDGDEQPDQVSGDDQDQDQEQEDQEQEESESIQITPSEYALENAKLKVILFNRIHEEILDKVKEDNFDSLQTFHGSSPVDSFAEIIETVDSLDYSQLINSKKKLLNDFVTFLRQKIPAKTAHPICVNWAPVIPRIVDNIESVLNLVIRLANQANDGNKILYWLSNALFPKAWGKKTSLMNSKIGAVCRCVIPPGRKAYWAVLDTNKTFKLFQLKKNTTVLEFECQVSRTRVHEDGRSVVITDADGNDVQTFLPVDINQAQMWGAALAKQHSPFPYFFSSYQTPLPPIYYHALYEAFTCTDMIILRCAAHPTVTPPRDDENRGHLLMDAFLDVFAHDAKVPLLINEMTAIELWGEIEAKDVLRKPSNYGNLVDVFVERFGKPYFENFVSKLLNYVKDKDCFASGLSGDATDVEIPLNTALKLIYNSSSLVPDQLKHVAQVLFSYSVIKFNNKQDVYSILARFFFNHVLFPMLKNPEQFGGEATDSENVAGFIQILKVVTQFGKLEDSLDELNYRMEHNVFPYLEQFLFSVGQLTDTVPEYEGVSPERFCKIIEYILYCISHKTPGVKNGDSFIQFVQRFNDAALPTCQEPMILPNNLHVAIAQFFQFRCDPEMQRLAEDGEDLDAPQDYFGPVEAAPQEDTAFPDMPDMMGEGGFPPIIGRKGSGSPFASQSGKAKGNIPPKKVVGAAKRTALPGKKAAPAKKAAAAAKKGAAGKKAAPAKKAAAGGKKPAAGAKKPAAGAKKPAAGAKKPAAGAKKAAPKKPAAAGAKKAAPKKAAPKKK